MLFFPMMTVLVVVATLGYYYCCHLVTKDKMNGSGIAKKIEFGGQNFSSPDFIFFCVQSIAAFVSLSWRDLPANLKMPDRTDDKVLRAIFFFVASSRGHKRPTSTLGPQQPGHHPVIVTVQAVPDILQRQLRAKKKTNFSYAPS